jgi:hypothetical protein
VCGLEQGPFAFIIAGFARFAVLVRLLFPLTIGMTNKPFSRQKKCA